MRSGVVDDGFFAEPYPSRYCGSVHDGALMAAIKTGLACTRQFPLSDLHVEDV